jgi:hypothetical protein
MKTGASGKAGPNVPSAEADIKRVLEDEVYVAISERLSKVVYSQLAAATVEGVAYHLVSKHEDTKNGHGAWKSLLDWYDGDMIQNETAENLRNKLDNLRLHTRVSASQYINGQNFRPSFKNRENGLIKGLNFDLSFIWSLNLNL